MVAKRVNIRLSEKAVQELEDLKRDLGLSSVTEVIRSSITLSKFLQKEKDSGNDIVLRNKKTNKERTIEFVK